ncbi:MAG TPA: PIN domain-containing protein [Thermoanaerobaculia bacterium]|jgi:predicted nucleic acid-binding protein|nr:PIN domain-containing protein [Thermoanaerobaculia bacterium]
MILVDTSVWIDYFKGRQTVGVGKLSRALDEEQPCGFSSAIYQEILQGADSEHSFARFGRYLSAQILFQPAHPLKSFADAAEIYLRCRRAGYTIRSTIDCLIAQIALENELWLLHNDKDFDHIAAVIPELRIL